MLWPRFTHGWRSVACWKVCADTSNEFVACASRNLFFEHRKRMEGGLARTVWIASTAESGTYALLFFISCMPPVRKWRDAPLTEARHLRTNSVSCHSAPAISLRSLRTEILSLHEDSVSPNRHTTRRGIGPKFRASPGMSQTRTQFCKPNQQRDCLPLSALFGFRTNRMGIEAD